MFSQNEEEKHILNYFNGFKGTLLDIGANDGVTFSNSFQLISSGWKALLVEPSSMAITKLRTVHKDRTARVTSACCAIGTENKNVKFYESGAHLPSGNDFSLLSTIVPAEKEKWNGVDFTETDVDTLTYAALCEAYNMHRFDFITIDAEGMDLEILKQIDLTKSGTRLLCIEWNSIQKVKDEILNYTALHGMTKVIYQSPENLLIAK